MPAPRLDSTADFPDAPQRFPNWRVVPLYVRFGDTSYRDYVDISATEFYERLRTAGELPTTSQPTPQDFQAAYDELARYDRILALTVSAKLSGTYESALRAAEDSGGRARVIDTATASAAIAMLALAVQRRLERGTTDEEIDDFVARFKREAGLIFTLDTLEFLARGGRIGRAAGWAGQLVGVVHADAPERMATVEQLVRDVRPNAEIEVATTLGPVVGTHAGPGTVGLFWFQD